MQRILLLIFSLFLFLNVTAQTPLVYSKVKIDLHNKSMRDLAATGVAVDHGEYKKGVSFTTELSSDELTILKKAGFVFTVLIPDVTKYYQQNHRKPSSKKKVRSTSCFPDQIYTTPAGFTYGSMGDYYTYQELLDQMDSLAAKYPNLVKAREAIDTFHSIEGRPIYWMKISDNPTIDEAEPEVLHTALHHAREPMGAMQMIFYMYYLCENYNTDPEVKYFVDHGEQYFIPIVNPDGYLYNQTTNPGGGGMWRKNRRPNVGGSFGVDLNRNYGYFWGYDNIGSSPTKTSETYRGTAGFSEPEIQAVRFLCEHHQFQFALNNHSYGDLLIYPWGYSDMSTVDSLTFITNAKEETDYNRFRYGTGTETVNYTTNGDSDDWMYGEQTTKGKIFSMTPEAGDDADGFWPPFSEILPQCNQNMHLNMNYMRCALAYATLDPVNTTFIKTSGNFSKYVFNNIGMDSNAIFVVSLIPITTNMTPGTPITYTAPPRYVDIVDSIPINLSPSVQAGDMVKYVVSIDNGYVKHYDTVTAYVSNTINTPFYSDCNSMSQWFASTTWNAVFTPTPSIPSFAITETPVGNSDNNENYTLTTLNAINLSNAMHAQLSFNAKWITECEYDYVQVSVSSDNGLSYTPLCTRKSMRSKNSNIPDEPSMDGFQLQWNYDEASLDDYLNKSIKIQFSVTTDAAITKDGFYVEDVMVKSIPSLTSSTNDLNASNEFTLYPNPVADILTIQSSMNDTFTWELKNCTGQEIKTGKGDASHRSISVAGLANGIYMLELVTSSGEHVVRKFVKD